MNFEADVVILGSGPAGVSAAFPLVESGFRVLMLDGGQVPEKTVPDVAYSEIRQTDSRQRALFVGDDFFALMQPRTPSPKLSSPTNAYVFAGYDDYYQIQRENFAVAGSLAAGGLSNAWGAGVSCLDNGDFEGFSLGRDQLRKHYVNVARRIGISGSENDDLSDAHGSYLPLQPPTQLNRNTEFLLKGYNRNRRVSANLAVKIGLARNAVISADTNNREGCKLRAMCVWGCAGNSIYSSRFDLEQLKKFPNFSYVPGALAEEISRAGIGYTVKARYGKNKESLSVKAKRVLLGCGTIGTTILIIKTLKLFSKEFRLLSNPSAAFALWVPKNLGYGLSKQAFGLSQLSFTVDYKSSTNDYAAGNIFGTDGILTSEFMRLAPFSASTSRRVMRLLSPSLLLGNCFLPGEYSSNYINVARNGEVMIRGRQQEIAAKRFADIRYRLRKVFSRCGLMSLPGAFKRAGPGEDIHYAGTLPMCSEPRAYECFPSGELAGLPGVFIVDGAALPRLPAKPHTLTIMANAERIATKLVADLKAKAY